MNPFSFIVLYAAALAAGALIINASRIKQRGVQGKRIKAIRGDNSKVTQLKLKLRVLLIENDVSNQWLITTMLLCAFCGFIVGKFMFTRTFLAAAMAVASAFLPFAFLDVTSEKHRHEKLAKLEASMLCITQNYLVEQDLTKVVRDNLHNLEYPKLFAEFVTDTAYIDANIVKALQKMKLKENNLYFSQWIDVFIQSQYDHGSVPLAMVVTKQMNAIKRMNESADANLFADWKQFFTILAIVFAVPICIRLLMNEWYNSLIYTAGGVLLCVLTIISVVFSVVMALKINHKMS